jgi:hypothetical protein
MIPLKASSSVATAALAILVLPWSAGCRGNADAAMRSEWWRLEADRIEVAHKVELLRVRLGKIEAREKELAALESELARAEERRELLAERAEGLRAGIEAESERLAGLHAARLRANREATPGRSFEVFQGAGGKSYHDVVITRVTDIGIEFRHASGSARLAASELTAAQRDAFGLVAELSDEALAAEGRTAEAYAAWVDRKVAETAARESDGNLVAAAAAPAAVVSPGYRSSLREQPRSFGNSSLWSPRYSRLSDRDVYLPDDYYVTPVSRAAVYGAGGGFQNIRVPSANWSFTPGNRCVPTPVRALPFTTTP